VSRLVCIAPNPAIDRTYDVERLVPGAIHRPVRVTSVAGGKGLNVARASRHLGADVTAVAILRGHAGRWIEDALAAADVPLRVVWAAGETRTCVSVCDPVTDGLTEIYPRGEPVPPEAWSDLETTVESAVRENAELLTISGGIPPGVDQGAFARLCAAGRSAGARVLLDSYGPGLKGALAERPWLVKVNEQEAAAVIGQATASESGAYAAARSLLEAGAGSAIVTRGRLGAVLATPDGGWSVGAPPAVGPYAVGSGDAFLAGVATGLLEDLPLTSAAKLGTGAACANATVPGQGDFDPAGARRLAGSVTVQKIEG
jgi:1-phosphofructokinase family hexose kinase